MGSKAPGSATAATQRTTSTTTTTTTTLPPTTTTTTEEPGWTVVGTDAAGTAVDERSFTGPSGGAVTVVRFRRTAVQYQLHVGSEDPPIGSAVVNPNDR